jgi:hypothetical protein
LWELEVALENALGCGDAVAVVTPVLYTIPAGAFDAGAADASALAEKARISPGCFAAGISAEARSASDGDDGPFRPECAVYGEDRLRLPVRLPRADAGGAAAEDGEGTRGVTGGADAEDRESKRDDAVGADIEIIVRVIDVFGNVSVMKLKVNAGEGVRA